MRIRTVVFLLFALLLMPAFAAGAECAVYFDDADDLYDPTEEAYIRQLLEEASAHTGWNYGIVTLHEDHSSEYSAGMRAEGIYNEQFGEDSSGVLFMCDIGYRYVVVAGDARNYVTGDRFDNMLRKMRDQYFDYLDLQCAITFIEYTEKYYDKGEGSFELYAPMLITSAVFGVIAAGVSLFVIFHTYGSHEKPATNNYLNRKSLDFYRRDDKFIRSYVTRYKTDSSRGGSGFGGRGGGGFGGSHGGGGFGGHR